jgi:hypothetical protein
MKRFTNIVLILVCILCISCHKQQEKIIASNTTTIEVPKVIVPEMVQTPEKSETDKIVGIYYVDAFYTYLKSGFALKIKKPSDTYGLYTFDFKEDGTIIYKDLTKFYGCGNGVLHIRKGTWSVKDNGIYTLTFDGEYAFESKFHTESEYSFNKLKNGNIYLKLHKVIAHEKNQNWDN